MKKIVEYQCETCKARYSNEAQALACEMRGSFNPAKFTPGLMFEYHHHGFVGIFAIPPDGARPSAFNKHLGNVSYWACRNNTYGDSLGEETCGGELVGSDPVSMEKWICSKVITPKRVGGPEFIRMVNYLRSQGIAPYYYAPEGQVVIMQKII